MCLELTAGLACRCTGEAAAAHLQGVVGRNMAAQTEPCRARLVGACLCRVHGSMCAVPISNSRAGKMLVMCSDGPVLTICIVLWSDKAVEHCVEQWKAA